MSPANNGNAIHTDLPAAVLSPSSLEAQNQRHDIGASGNEGSINSSPPGHGAFKFLTLLLIALLAMKYQGISEDPFETHTANMWVFIAAISVYCLALGLLKQMQINSTTFTQTLGYVMILFGSLSTASLASIFLPSSLGWLVFVVWAMFSVVLTGALFKRAYGSCLCKRIEIFTKWVHDKFSKFEGRNQMQEPYLPTTIITPQPALEMVTI